MELDYQTHLAWFAVSVLNDHFPHPEEDDPADDNPDMGSPGCVVNCGPCSALHWFSQTEERRAVFEAHVRLTGFHIGGWSHWDGPTDRLLWDFFTAYWARHKGCSVSNGIVGPCKFSDEE